jgi:hypothetical protein
MARLPEAWVHIRPQNYSHDSAEIVGTRNGLIALTDAINNALANTDGVAVVFASDGEGYEVRVRKSSTIDGIGEPYYALDVASEMARGEFYHLVEHKKLIDKQTKEATAALIWCRKNGDPHKTQTP